MFYILAGLWAAMAFVWTFPFSSTCNVKPFVDWLIPTAKLEVPTSCCCFIGLAYCYVKPDGFLNESLFGFWFGLSAYLFFLNYYHHA